MTPEQMRALTDALHTKSDRIRALAAHGVKRADIARFLSLRYQHVRNVLEADRLKQEAEPAPEGAETPTGPVAGRLDAAGRVALPAAWRASLGLSEGDEIVMRMEDDGEIRLTTRAAALERARDLYRRFVPEGDSLSDELLADRRREGQDESDAG